MWWIGPPCIVLTAQVSRVVCGLCENRVVHCPSFVCGVSRSWPYGAGHQFSWPWLSTPVRQLQLTAQASVQEGVCASSPGLCCGLQGVCGLCCGSQGVCGLCCGSQGVCGLCCGSLGVCGLCCGSQGVCGLCCGSQGVCLWSLLHVHTHTHTRTRTNTRTHAHAHAPTHRQRSQQISEYIVSFRNGTKDIHQQNK